MGILRYREGCFKTGLRNGLVIMAGFYLAVALIIVML